ncbi:MAG: hypothetical protein K0S32_719 [Bacteroidetes bacterium]|jgi:hypothetical protein|nr:hypothetical protein [Bacteroidota bacterium]
MKTKFFNLFLVAGLAVLAGLFSCRENNPENSSYHPPQEPDSEYPGSKLYDSLHGDTAENKGNHH